MLFDLFKAFDKIESSHKSYFFCFLNTIFFFMSIEKSRSLQIQEIYKFQKQKKFKNPDQPLRINKSSFTSSRIRIQACKKNRIRICKPTFNTIVICSRYQIIMAWHFCQMVTKNMLRTHEGKQVSPEIRYPIGYCSRSKQIQIK